jgi:hypothetical protein
MRATRKGSARAAKIGGEPDQEVNKAEALSLFGGTVTAPGAFPQKTLASPGASV